MEHNLSKLVNAHFCLTILLIFTSLFFLSTTSIGSDLGWHLFVAGKMLEGKRLYHDFFEVNFPMIFYLTIIPAFISKTSGITDTLILKIFNFVLAISMFLLSLQILRKQLTRQDILVISPYIAALIFILPFCFPVSEFGQKEHLFVILTLPYLLTLFSTQNSTKVRIIVAVFAGIGFTIKPFFIIWFLVIELINWMKTREIFRIENIIIASILACYYLYFFLFEQIYFHEILPIALTSYRYLLHHDNYFLFFIYEIVLTSGFALVGAPLVATLDNKKKIILLSLMMSMAMVIFLQKQLFWYHFIPLIAVFYLGVGFVIVEAFNGAQQFKLYKISFILVIFIGGSVLTAVDYYRGIKKYDASLEKVENEIAQLDSKDIFILTARADYTFPLVNHLKINWPSKEHWLQTLEGILKRKFIHGDLNTAEVENYVAKCIINALKTSEYLIIHTPKDNKHDSYMVFYLYGDYIMYFNQYPEFNVEFSKFEYLKDIEHDSRKLVVYKKVRG